MSAEPEEASDYITKAEAHQMIVGAVGVAIAPIMTMLELFVGSKTDTLQEVHPVTIEPLPQAEVVAKPSRSMVTAGNGVVVYPVPTGGELRIRLMSGQPPTFIYSDANGVTRSLAYSEPVIRVTKAIIDDAGYQLERELRSLAGSHVNPAFQEHVHQIAKEIVLRAIAAIDDFKYSVYSTELPKSETTTDNVISQ